MLFALLSLASPVDFTGYLVDTLCWSYPNHEAPPTRNTPLAERPYDHTLECLRDISFCFDDLKLLAFDNATQRYDVNGAPDLSYQNGGHRMSSPSAFTRAAARRWARASGRRSSRRARKSKSMRSR